jgi:hypothetical protein
MEHLSTLDAGFLEAEDSDRHVSLAVGGVSIITHHIHRAALPHPGDDGALFPRAQISAPECG